MVTASANPHTSLSENVILTDPIELLLSSACARGVGLHSMTYPVRESFMNRATYAETTASQPITSNVTGVHAGVQFFWQYAFQPKRSSRYDLTGLISPGSRLENLTACRIRCPEYEGNPKRWQSPTLVVPQRSPQRPAEAPATEAPSPWSPRYFSRGDFLPLSTTF